MRPWHPLAVARGGRVHWLDPLGEPGFCCPSCGETARVVRAQVALCLAWDAARGRWWPARAVKLCAICLPFGLGLTRDPPALPILRRTA